MGESGNLTCSGSCRDIEPGLYWYQASYLWGMTNKVSTALLG